MRKIKMYLGQSMHKIYRYGTCVRGPRPRSFRLMTFAAASIFGIAAVTGYLIGTHVSYSPVFSDWQNKVITEYQQMTNSSHAELNLLTQKLALLEVRLSRMDILGDHLTDLYQLDNGEFDFSRGPGVGGLSNEVQNQFVDPQRLKFALSRLETDLDETEMQIKILSDLIDVSGLKKQMLPVGWPVDAAWVSSRFGYRISPFSGRRELHSGLDIAGQEGSRISAVASGVVKQARWDRDYGNMVEISHGNGYSTRYAHNQINLVQLGDSVKKGDVIALLGNTGRSTGPHLHFEVIKKGRRIDPADYLARR